MKPAPDTDAGQNSCELGPAPELLLRHQEMHAPTFGAIDGEHPLYDLAAWAYHHAEESPPNLRASLMAGLWQAWPRAEGRRRGVRADGQHSGKRLRAQWAHYWLHVVGRPGDSVEGVAQSLGWSEEHTKRTAREFIPEAEREQRHEEDYGIPRVVLAYPDRDASEDVPDGALLAPSWHGQMMLSDDPDRYRRKRHREATRRPPSRPDGQL